MLEDLSHHILDIAENGVNAGASAITIELEDDEYIRLTVKDNGRGMDESTARSVVDPFYTTRTERRVGLGLPFLKQLAELCGGKFLLRSSPGKGTDVSATFRKDSVDTPPLGDIPSTLLTLLVGNPQIAWRYIHRVGNREFVLDSEELAEALGGGNPFADAALAVGIKEFIATNIEELSV
ncbi:MAG: ATP-binding protein [Synergistaceae bacterium]|nr:ATP-binding protein [Synergistota bacterium]NLM71891.1 ATP-binding protein [Synergistaceae bacterium]